eukprot:356361-Pleurochrysis_carterae.AAC.2
MVSAVRDHAPLWVLPSARAALETAQAETTTFAQCALGAAARKYTTLAHAAALTPHLGRLRDAVCTHGDDGDPTVAYGRDAQGRARSALAAAYPPEMNAVLAEALLRADGWRSGTMPTAA